MSVNDVEFVCKLPLLLGVNRLRQDLLSFAVKKLLYTRTSKSRQRRKQNNDVLPLFIEHLLCKRWIEVQLVHELVAQLTQILDCLALLACWRQQACSQVKKVWFT